jgi:hypothetical protein
MAVRSATLLKLLIGSLALWSTCMAWAQSAPQDLVIGAWRHIALVRIIDGTTLAPQQFDGSTTVEFKSDGTWQMVAPSNRSAGTYRWLPTGELETTTLESGLAIQVGTVSAKQVRVDHMRLNLITVQTKAEAAKFLPPPKPGVTRPDVVTVTSIFSREPSE